MASAACSCSVLSPTRAATRPTASTAATRTASTPSVSRSVRCSAAARPNPAHRSLIAAITRTAAHSSSTACTNAPAHTLFPTQHSHFIVK